MELTVYRDGRVQKITVTLQQDPNDVE
jgi:hypothetical protein